MVESRRHISDTIRVIGVFISKPPLIIRQLLP